MSPTNSTGPTMVKTLGIFDPAPRRGSLQNLLFSSEKNQAPIAMWFKKEAQRRWMCPLYLEKRQKAHLGVPQIMPDSSFCVLNHPFSGSPVLRKPHEETMFTSGQPHSCKVVVSSCSFPGVSTDQVGVFAS